MQDELTYIRDTNLLNVLAWCRGFLLQQLLSRCAARLSFISPPSSVDDNDTNQYWRKTKVVLVKVAS